MDSAKGPMLGSFPLAPPIRVKDAPHPHELTTLGEARAFVDDMLTQGRAAPWREVHARLKHATTEEEAIEAIGDLRELLSVEELLQPTA
ncbi:MAG TPA: hypothetical protein VFB45_25125 [Pseudolabrys sp.]|nr:hypothetical protein [Pseudolabrys sp.]